jgi:chromosome segregation ATPase
LPPSHLLWPAETGGIFGNTRHELEKRMAEVAELKAQLKASETEMEDAKEALRIERAKMTRERKQWALDRKAEEKRWAEDMAQLSREKRMWAEEKERLNSPRVVLGEKERWDQERKSLLEQHRQEVQDLTARLARAEDAPSQPVIANAEAVLEQVMELKRVREQEHAEWDQERQRLHNELADLSAALGAAKRDLQSAEASKVEAEDQLAAAELKAADAERRLHLERKAAEVKTVELQRHKGSEGQAEALIAKVD